MAERRYTLVFYGALVVAAIATYGVYQMMSSVRARSRVPTRSVVVASRDVPEGTSFDRITLTMQQWPATAVPAGAYTRIDSVVGRVARVPVFEGEAIVPGRLAPTGSAAGLETKISRGSRAMAVRINDVAGISGLLQPNSRVDVLVTLSETGSSEHQIAKLFMENMRVLSVGTVVQRDNEGKPINATTVTLGVTPEEAERLAVAMNRGSIQLVMRGYGDPDTVRTAGATSSDVLAQLQGRPSTPQPQQPARRVTPASKRPKVNSTPVAVTALPTRPESLRVEVYRGDKATKQLFEKTAATPSTQEQ